MRLLLSLMVITAGSVAGSVFYVDDVSTSGTGIEGSPFNTIAAGLNAAQPGDTVFVKPGTYTSQVTTRRNGESGNRITLKAFDPNNPPLITRSGRVLDITKVHFTIDGFIIDGQFGGSDIVRVRSTASHAQILNCEVRNSTRDGIDISSADSVLIQGCKVHHTLAGTFTTQADAHGIVATGQNHLVIRDCEVYYISGDCFQTDPNRNSDKANPDSSIPHWDDVLIEDCVFWTGPLPADAAGFKQGEVPGENAIDTKVDNYAPNLPDYRPKLTLRNVTAYGFVEGYIGNRAAYNVKEKVACRMEGVIAYNNHIAFRLRGDDGSAHVTMVNCIAYDNDVLIRAEDNLKLLHVYNCTFDNCNTWIREAGGGYDAAGFEMKNCLFLGTKPNDASDASNLSANAGFFKDAANNDYQLAIGSPAIDAGVDIVEVTADITGEPRKAGEYDVGAYEFLNTGVSWQLAEGSWQALSSLPVGNETPKMGYDILGNSAYSAGRRTGIYLICRPGTQGIEKILYIR